LARQVCTHPDSQTHALPGNALLPPHHGMIITRGLQEWACLLPQELPFAAVARLLGWQTQQNSVLSDTTIRTIVRTHGQIIRQAERAEVAALLQQDDLTPHSLQVVPHGQVRRCAGWPAELTAAVATALAAEQLRPPDGSPGLIGSAHWRPAGLTRRARSRSSGIWGGRWLSIRCWLRSMRCSPGKWGRTTSEKCVRHTSSRQKVIAI
jgi:hypothetical protein